MLAHHTKRPGQARKSNSTSSWQKLLKRTLTHVTLTIQQTRLAWCGFSCWLECLSRNVRRICATILLRHSLGFYALLQSPKPWPLARLRAQNTSKHHGSGGTQATKGRGIGCTRLVAGTAAGCCADGTGLQIHLTRDCSHIFSVPTGAKGSQVCALRHLLVVFS